MLLLALCAAQSALAGPLVPDIQTNPLPTSPFDYQLQNGEFRFTNGWANHGQGPWETVPAGPASSEDCDGDGDALNDLAVDQNVYQDGNGNDVFNRGIDTTIQPHPAGCMIYHPSHGHFHVNDAGTYTLLSEATGQPVGASSKVSFCLLDVAPFDTSLPGAPNNDYYDSCNPDLQGISIGWYDEYGYYLDGQEIPLNGAPPGNYCLHSEFDPLNRFLELDDTNNAAEQRYFLNPSTGQVSPLSGPCTFSPPPPPQPPAVDRDDPQTKITFGPRGRTHDHTPMFGFRADEPSTLKCKLDHSRWRRCLSPKRFGPLEPGEHVFKARAIDKAKNKDPKPALRHFQVVD